MAGDWLKFEKATPDKPEVFAMSVALGLDPDAIVGKLLRVWSWFDTHTESGNAKSVTHSFLDRIAGAAGFAVAMQNVSWLLLSDDGVSLPSFDKHTGQTAKARAETARRVSQHRASHKPVRGVVPRPLRRDIVERDGNKCVYCARPEGQYTPPELATAGVMALDHVIPLSRGGSDDDRNLVCACTGCNMLKSGRTPDESGLKWPVDASGKRYGNSVTGALPREEKRREEQKEQKQQPARQAARFAEWWAAYPKKIARKAAEQKWRAADLDPIADRLIADVRQRVECDDGWVRGFVPDPMTYLNQERWNDDLRTAPAARVALSAPSKTLSAIQKLEGMKHGLAGNRNPDGHPEVALLGFGPNPGDRSD
jgi:5-methylcytosine-specific restriction endonuclease McrA